jgi:hypothetical protein
MPDSSRSRHRRVRGDDHAHCTAAATAAVPITGTRITAAIASTTDRAGSAAIGARPTIAIAARIPGRVDSSASSSGAAAVALDAAGADLRVIAATLNATHLATLRFWQLISY